MLHQESSSSVVVTGVRFLAGSPGPREMCFSYGNYVEHVIVKVDPGVPAKLELVSGPEQVKKVLILCSHRSAFLILT